RFARRAGQAEHLLPPVRGFCATRHLAQILRGSQLRNHRLQGIAGGRCAADWSQSADRGGRCMSVTHMVPALLQAIDPNNTPVQGMPFFLFTVLKMLVIFTVYMVGVAMLTLAERKISAWIQDRHGPNRVGKGWLQPAADGLKNFMKEETMPAGVNKPIFVLAPILSFIPALTAWCVIPFGAPVATRWGRVDLVVADLPVGFLFILAITSLGVYGIVLAGWSSNNKYALLGGLRSSAQMVSYEISMGMSLIPVLLLAGNVTLNTIVNQQAQMHLWNVLTL